MTLPHRRPSLETVAEIVEHLTGVTAAEILGELKTNRIAGARQLTAYLLHEYGEMSYPEIGRAIGYRCHSPAVAASKRTLAKLEACERLLQTQ